ncbi:MAG: hypothetical protein QM813_06410 [Verrucomicrobiota bacterium]
MTLLKLLLISVGCLLLGLAATCGVISGIESIPFAPLFAVFGWFYIFPIFGLVAVMWAIYTRRFQPPLFRALYILSGLILGGGAMAVLGLHNQGDQMFYGLLLGGILAGGFATSMITLLKRYAT